MLGVLIVVVSAVVVVEALAASLQQVPTDVFDPKDDCCPALPRIMSKSYHLGSSPLGLAGVNLSSSSRFSNLVN